MQGIEGIEMQGSVNFDGSLVGNITRGGGGDTVVITPVVTSGTKIADVSINGVEKELYCPTPPTPTEVEVTPVVTSGTKIADVSVGGVEKDLYTPDYGADITALDGRLDIAEDNITSLTGRVGTAEGNITNLAGHMTEAETDITEIKQSLSDLGSGGYTVVQGSAFPSGIMFGGGGYCQIGKLVIVNMRLSLSNSVSSGGFLLTSGLPLPNNQNNIVFVGNNRMADITYRPEGIIGTATDLASGTVIMSFSYVTA